MYVIPDYEAAIWTSSLENLPNVPEPSAVGNLMLKETR